MNTQEIRFYLGIISANLVAIALILFLYHFHQRSIYNLPIGINFILILGLSHLISHYFWQSIGLKTNEYLKYYSLNVLVVLFWFVLLFS